MVVSCSGFRSWLRTKISVNGERGYRVFGSWATRETWQHGGFCMCTTKNNKKKKCTYREYSAMARWISLLLIKFICFTTGFRHANCQFGRVPTAAIASVTVLGETVQNLTFDIAANYLVKVEGVNLSRRTLIRLTSATGSGGDVCQFDRDNRYGDESDVVFHPLFVNETLGYFTVIVDQKGIREPLYLCVGEPALNSSITPDHGQLIKWIHQGRKVFLPNSNHRVNDSEKSVIIIGPSSDGRTESPRRRRDVRLPENLQVEDGRGFYGDFRSVGTTMASLAKKKRAIEDVQVAIHGMRVESAENSPSFGDDGVVELLAHSTCNVRLFGTGLSADLNVAFTTTESDDGFCEFPSSEIFRVVEGSVSNYSAVIEIRVPSRPTNNVPYFLCIKSGLTNATGSTKKLWHHQGSSKWLQFRVYERLLPVWMTIVILISLLFFSALFSGLTLGLMSMDKTDLKILCTTGTELERQYASAIMPVRSHGSLLLCSLLLGNVLVNSVLTILMDDLTSGLIAVVFSTLAIVIFGEIMPQAICSRHGLAIGAKTIYITKFVILLTCVVAFPISKILDYMLGEEIGNVYNRERLKELVKTGTDIEKDEVNIISGALELRKKTVAEVMTKLEDVYMLDYHAILDFETVSEIMKSGFSRIPVYEGQRSNIVAMLFIKDLAFIDPDDNTPLKQLCDFYQNQCYFVFEDLTLDILFKHFKDGNKGHMAFVTRVNAEGEGDPFYEAIGLVTLEDVIEELIQAEIVDETDVFTDNRSKRKRERKHMKQDFTTFCERRENQRIHISPQLTLATFQYLSTMDAFKPNVISERILRRLIKQDVIYQIKVKNREKGKTDPATIIYQQGKPVDYFVLILEGRVEVTVGREEMRFESGPFTYFGTQALTQSYGVGGDSPTTAMPSSNTGSLQSVNLDNASRQTFVADYTVRAITEVFYIKIKRSLYLAAKRATLMENSQKTDDHFDDEVDKLLHSLDEDDKSQGQTSADSPTLTRNLIQSEKESHQQQQRCNSPVAESSKSNNPMAGSATAPATAAPTPTTLGSSGSPHEINGSVRSPLSPVRGRGASEDNALLKIFSEKLASAAVGEGGGSEKMENSSLEERTNLLRQSDEIS